MNWKTLSLLPLLHLSEVDGAVVVTYRSRPSVVDFNNSAYDSFDVNGDGLADFRFAVGSLTSAFLAFGENRFIATLAAEPSAGGVVDPVYHGDILGSDVSSRTFGAWHKHTDNRGLSGFSLTSGLRALQFENAFIGVEFMAADGVHYGWIQFQGFSHPDTVIDTAIGQFHPPAGTLGGLVNSWAYESEPGKPIIAGAVPEPSSALLFTAGVTISFFRRKRKTA